MGDLKDKLAKAREASKKAAQETNDRLADDIAALSKLTAIDLQKLKPKVKDQVAYNLLINAVQESTTKNEGLAQLKERVEKLGDSAKDALREVIDLVK